MSTSTDGRPARPMTPDGLLGWIRRQPNARTSLRRAVRLGEALGFGGYIKGWTLEQVATVYHELATKPERGSQAWGGSGRARRAD